MLGALFEVCIFLMEKFFVIEEKKFHRIGYKSYRKVFQFYDDEISDLLA